MQGRDGGSGKRVALRLATRAHMGLGLLPLHMGLGLLPLHKGLGLLPLRSASANDPAAHSSVPKVGRGGGGGRGR